MIHSVFNTFFPRVCVACEDVLLDEEAVLCLSCLHALPLIEHPEYGAELIKDHFYGRIPIAHAAALFLFHKKGISQQVLHRLKYKGDERISGFLGSWLGEILTMSSWTKDIDLIIPVPLSKRRQRRRGYNQVSGFGKTLAFKLNTVFREDLLLKISDVRTQVFKNRFARARVDKGYFTLNHPDVLTGKHILLVDDLITTGATLEACAEVLLRGNPLKISLATMAITV